LRPVRISSIKTERLSNAQDVERTVDIVSIMSNVHSVSEDSQLKMENVLIYVQMAILMKMIAMMKVFILLIFIFTHKEVNLLNLMNLGTK
jgi:hypothetical protein